MIQHATILLVEDNEDDVILIERAFAKARLINPLQVVRDGEEAIAYLAGEGAYNDRDRYPFPLMLLLDLHLPRRDGFEVLNWLQDRPDAADLNIVVLTSSTDQHDFARARSLGADSYLVKPGGLTELADLMLRIKGHWLLLDKRPDHFPVTIAA